MGIHKNNKKLLVLNKGDKFGRLTFIKDIRIGNRRCGKFKCECGNIITPRLQSVVSGNCESCGCIRVESIINRSTTHGLCKNPLFSRYVTIVDRCTNPNNKAYKYYGARGIKCEWKNVEDFIKDMFPTYKKGLSIDRIDNNGNYCKENCRWSTMKEQSRNRRSNIMIGDMCLLDYCKLHGLKFVTIQTRINKLGWSIEDAINIPIQKIAKNNHLTK